MSEIRVNKIIDEGGTGAPILTYGCEVPVGYGITGAGGLNVSGACTASGGFVGNVTGNVTGNASGSSGSCTGNAGGLSGSPNITINNLVGVAATFTGNVSIAGTLTYEDVTNIDSVGIVTARTGIKVLADGINAVGVVTATKFSGPTNIPGNVTTGAYSLVAADAGKLVSATGTVTLPAATFAVGDAISVYNNTGSNMTLDCNAPTKVYLGTDGSTKISLTLALRCICTFVCVDAGSNGSFVAAGGGLS